MPAVKALSRTMGRRHSAKECSSSDDTTVISPVRRLRTRRNGVGNIFAGISTEETRLVRADSGRRASLDGAAAVLALRNAGNRLPSLDPENDDIISCNSSQNTSSPGSNHLVSVAEPVERNSLRHRRNAICYFDSSRHFLQQILSKVSDE